MIQRGEDFGFTLETGEPIGVISYRFGKDFDGDLTLQFRVCRPVHLAHAPFPDLGGDFIRAEAGTGSQGQWVAEDYGRRE
jgi:hypothetical protein